MAEQQPKNVAVEGIHAEKSQRDANQKPWYWLLGDTYPQRETLKQHGARFSRRRKAWYYIGWELPDALRTLVSKEAPAPQPSPMSAELAAMIEETLAADDAVVAPVADTEAVPAPQPEPSSDIEPPLIRIIKPQPLAGADALLDDVQRAIVQAKSQLTPALHPSAGSQKRTLVAIGQTYIGELTGSISGDVHCYGYAIHEGICIFVNMGGPRMAVEAVRAKLSKGDIVSCTPWDAPAIELTAGEGNSGMYHDFMQNISEAKFTSLILRTDEAQAAAKLKHHVTELVKVPVFDEWAGYLYHAGQTAMLVRQTRSAGEIDLLTVMLDVDARKGLSPAALSRM
jgi:hypothetical protein